MAQSTPSVPHVKAAAEGAPYDMNLSPSKSLATKLLRKYITNRVTKPQSPKWFCSRSVGGMLYGYAATSDNDDHSGGAEYPAICIVPCATELSHRFRARTIREKFFCNQNEQTIIIDHDFLKAWKVVQILVFAAASTCEMNTRFIVIGHHRPHVLVSVSHRITMLFDVELQPKVLSREIS